jgi:hypothetical protein
MRWLWLVLLVGCGRVAAENYCCDDPAVCARVVSCASGATCDLAGAYGVSNVCVVVAEIVDAGVDATAPCTANFDCIGAPGGPACVDGECVACNAELGCTPSAPRCMADHTCGPCSSDSDCEWWTVDPVCTPAGFCAQCADGSLCTTASQSVCDPEVFVCRPCQRDQECASLVCNSGTCLSGVGRVAVAAPGAPVNGACTVAAPCGSFARAAEIAAVEGLERIFVFPGTYTENVVVSGGDIVVSAEGSLLRGSLTVESAGQVRLRGLRIEPTSGPGLLCREVDLRAEVVDVVGSPVRGVVVDGGCSLKLVEAEITDNRGGGIDVIGQLATASSLIARNGSAASGFGAIRSSGGKVSLAFTTVVANQAAVGRPCAVDASPSAAVHIESSIVYYNACASPLPESYTSEASDIEGSMDSQNIDLPPMFVDLEGGDYHLRQVSPCINAALSPSGTDTDNDIDHEPRLHGFGLADMGADEFRLPPP